MRDRGLLDAYLSLAPAEPARSGAPGAGFTLVELLVGLAVGLMIIGGVIQTWVAASAASRVQADLAESAERIRFTVEHMSRDLRMAGLETTENAIEFADGKLTGRYGEITVTYSAANGSLRYLRTEGGTVVINNQPIVDGVEAMAVWFGIGDPSDGGVRFMPAEAVPGSELIDVWGMRVLLSFAGHVLYPSREVETTIAMRNQLLASSAPVL